jgi:periplasmic divalent cation tolerance protein
MPDPEFCQVSTTTDSEEAANSLAASAVEARLAAFGQVVGPIRSRFWWEGKIDDAQEWLILFKTTADKADALQAHILANHSYDVPEVIRTPITGGNPAYLAWIGSETTAP